MPSNEVIINGNTKYEVPDSYMEPLEAYLEMVKEKTLNVVFDAQDDGGPEEGQVHGQGAPTVLDAVKDPVPVQNESFARKLANESLHMVSVLGTKLELAALMQDVGTTPGVSEARPVVHILQAIHSHLEKIVKRDL